jgi:uncharacterized protein YggE
MHDCVWVLIFFILLVVATYWYYKMSPQRTITVYGTGEISKVSDQAIIVAGVSKVSDTLKQAQQEGIQSMNNLLATLNKTMDSSLIQTDRFSLSPATNEKGERTGYKFDQTIRVTIPLQTLKLDQVVSLFGEVDLVDTQFQLSPTEYKAAQSEANQQAMSDAFQKAENILKPLHHQVGKVMQVDTLDASVNGLGGRSMAMWKSAPFVSPIVPTIPTQDVHVSEKIKVTFAIM